MQMGLFDFTLPMIRSTLIACCILLTSCSIFRPSLPPPKVEFRAVWIATVANIDWPPSSLLPWEEKKAAFTSLLDFYQDLNFNTVIVQVRCAGDALYSTEKAPWSRYLSGQEGHAPDTSEDPLSWMIEQAHRRGMQFHAWLNPYRATMSLDTTALAKSHDFYLHREWMIAYGNRYYYNPGLPEVQDQLVDIMREVVVNYPVDGIHFDDYFYPYRIEGAEFNDSPAFDRFSANGQSLDDWRRSNVDSLIKKVHRSVKEVKPWVEFGISPFGVWRNNDKDPAGSDTRAGQTTYDDLFADPLHWMKNGWLDYIVPQLYWSMDFPAASYRKLVAWWAENSLETRLYIGNAAYKIRDNADEAWSAKRELPRQLALAREFRKVGGNVLFSAKSLKKHPDIVQNLRKRFYRYPALPPPAAKSVVSAPLPQLRMVEDAGNYYRFTLEDDPAAAWSYVLFYKARRAESLDTDDPSQLAEKVYLDGRRSFNLGKQLLRRKRVIGLTFLDSYGRESEPIIVHLNQTNQNDTEK